MSIMDLFRSPAVPTIAPVVQQQQPVVQSDPSKGNPTVPGDATPKSDGNGPVAMPKVGEGDKSPLDGFKNLWDKDKNDPSPTSLVPTINADPKKLMDAASKVDFTAAIKPEVLEKAAKGDATALAQAINSAAQLGFAQAAAATTQIVTAALKEQETTFHAKVIPEILRNNEISTTLRADNEIFNHPAVAPMLKTMEDQLAMKFPQASAKEINVKAKEFLNGFAESVVASSGRKITDPEQSQQTGIRRQQEDWSKFFGETS